jgi:hypothetical protein
MKGSKQLEAQFIWGTANSLDDSCYCINLTISEDVSYSIIIIVPP